MTSNHHKLTFKSFFFPLSPHKIFKTNKLIVLIAILFALKMVLAAATIQIPIINKAIGLALVPTMLMGWIFGPIYGLLLGAFADTAGYLMHPTNIWFWQYAIQQPLVAIIAGVIKGIWTYRTSKRDSWIVVDIIIHQIAIFGFCLVSLFSLLFWMDDGNKGVYTFSKWIAIGSLLIYLIVMETYVFFFIFDLRFSKNKIITFIYATLVVNIVTVIVSFLLGPIVSVNYLKYINGHYPSDYIKYGLVFFLIPRMIIESVKTPLESFILYSVILISSQVINNYMNVLDNKWVE